MTSILATNPDAPFLCTIPKRLHPGQIFTISGQVLEDGNNGSFYVHCKDWADTEVIFHLSVRPSEDSIVRNSSDKSGWGKEESCGGCPIKYNEGFKMIILVENDKFKVTINDSHFCEFHHRKPLSTAKFFYIDGNIKIRSVEIRDEFIR